MDKSVKLDEMNVPVDKEMLLKGMRKMVDNLNVEDLDGINFKAQSVDGISHLIADFSMKTGVDGLNIDIKSGDTINVGHFIKMFTEMANHLVDKEG